MKLAALALVTTLGLAGAAHADPDRAEALKAAIAPPIPTRIPAEGDVWELR